MISETAMDDVEMLERAGVKLPPREIVRLNAAGLKVERRPDGAEMFALPRVAFLGDLRIREPAVGHLVYVDEASEFVDMDDPMTSIAFFAFVLSKDVDDLPEISRIRMQWMVKGFIRRELKRFTVAQIRTAVEFALYGDNAADGERGASDETDAETEAARASVGVGLMREAQTLNLGISVADMKHATMSGLRAVVDRAYELRGVEIGKRQKNAATGEYFKLLDELKKTYGKQDPV